MNPEPLRRRVCVFCGSRNGRRPQYLAAATQLGGALARRGHELVYGGGRVGLMGALADAALAEGGRVIGVIPERLSVPELAHDALTELHVVETMHQRKQRMHDLCDTFVALPGGIGTFEELFEMATWQQLGYHRKPVLVLDLCDYYAALLALLTHAESEGFLSPTCRSIFVRCDDVDEILAHLEEPPPLPPALVS